MLPMMVFSEKNFGGGDLVRCGVLCSVKYTWMVIILVVLIMVKM